MRLVANENFPSEAVDARRAAGHDVIWIRTHSPSATDRSILKIASDETRLLITFDKDFGELAFHSGLPADSGIILFRIRPISSDYTGKLAVAALATRTDWTLHFTVIEEARIRMRRLPSSQTEISQMGMNPASEEKAND